MQKRAVAIATALALVCVGLFARWHAADAAHAHEQSGRVVHAQALADHHVESATDHLHEREAHGHAGECHLLAMAHAPIALAATPVVATPAAATAPAVADPRTLAWVAITTYRIAPKTSPPTV